MAEILVFPFDDGELVVDSRLIAQDLNIEHRSFMTTIRNYQNKIESAFGFIRFDYAESTGGRPERFAYLTEDQATVLMTFSKNTDEVVDSKIKLVKAFSLARKLILSALRGRGSYWYKRIGIAISDSTKPLESGYFCVYLEMMRFFSELEIRLGYVIADIDIETGDHLVPDISIAKRFNTWMRSEDEMSCEARKKFLGSAQVVDFRPPRNLKDGFHPEGKNYHEIKMYNHVYPKESHGEFTIQEARAYPNEYKSIFHYYLEEYWIPDICVSYLQKRDPEGLKGIYATLAVMPEEAKNALSVTLVGKLIRALPPVQ